MLLDFQQYIVLFIILGILWFLFWVAVGAAVLNINIMVKKILSLMEKNNNGENSVSN